MTWTNSTSAAITIGVQFGSGATSADGFTVSPSDASQMVPASGSLVLTLAPPAALAANGISAIIDTLVISFTDANGPESFTVGVVVNPHGAILSLQVPGTPAGSASQPLSFGNVPVTLTGNSGLQIINTGNLAATGVSLSVVSPMPAAGDGTFGVASPTPATNIVVPAGNSASPVTVVASYSAPATTGTDATAQYSALTDTTDVICNTLQPLDAVATPGSANVTTLPATIHFTGPGTATAGGAPIPGNEHPPATADRQRLGATTGDAGFVPDHPATNNGLAVAATINQVGASTRPASTIAVAFEPRRRCTARRCSRRRQPTPCWYSARCRRQRDHRFDQQAGAGDVAGHATERPPLFGIREVATTGLAHAVHRQPRANGRGRRCSPGLTAPAPVDGTSTLAFPSTPAGSAWAGPGRQYRGNYPAILTLPSPSPVTAGFSSLASNQFLGARRHQRH